MVPFKLPKNLEGNISPISQMGKPKQRLERFKDAKQVRRQSLEWNPAPRASTNSSTVGRVQTCRFPSKCPFNPKEHKKTPRKQEYKWEELKGWESGLLDLGRRSLPPQSTWLEKLTLRNPPLTPFQSSSRPAGHAPFLTKPRPLSSQTPPSPSGPGKIQVKVLEQTGETLVKMEQQKEEGTGPEG